jgi:hypothetical protein
MNRKQRKRKLLRRRESPQSGPSAAQLKYSEITAKAKHEGHGESWVLVRMQQAGFLPNGSGGWRPMTEREQEMWQI